MNMLDKIKDIASKKGITITDIEKDCSLPPKSIYKWNKNMPSIDRVIKVADYLKVDVNCLISDTDNNNYTKLKESKAIDTIAAHLEDKDITDDKIKALTQYMDLLFDKKK